MFMFTHSFFPPPSHRSRACDHPEDGDTWFHASAHPGDAGELRGTGGAWSWGRKGEGGRRSQRRGGNRARELSPESVPKIHPLPQPEPGALHPLISAPLHLKFHAQQLCSTLSMAWYCKKQKQKKHPHCEPINSLGHPVFFCLFITSIKLNATHN